MLEKNPFGDAGDRDDRQGVILGLKILRVRMATHPPVVLSGEPTQRSLEANRCLCSQRVNQLSDLACTHTYVYVSQNHFGVYPKLAQHC